MDPIPDPLPNPGPGQPLPPTILVPVLNPTVDQLTSLFEIGFSGANILKLNFAQRMEDIQNDYRITDHFAIGLSGSYAHTWTQLQPAGSVGVNTGLGGIYATYFDR